MSEFVRLHSANGSKKGSVIVPKSKIIYAAVLDEPTPEGNLTIVYFEKLHIHPPGNYSVHSIASMNTVHTLEELEQML